MRTDCLPALLATLLLSCHSQPAAAPPPEHVPPGALTLPAYLTAPAPAAPPAPIAARNLVEVDPTLHSVTVAEGKVLLDGKPVDEVTSASRYRLSRLDGLFASLKAARSEWENSHPGATFSGGASFRLEGNDTITLAKNVFETAAFAGFPNGGFVVQRADAPEQVGLMPFDVNAPWLNKTAPKATHDEPWLLVDVRRTGVRLSWIDGQNVTAPVDRALPSDARTNVVAELGAVIDAEWRAHGSHRDATDARFDHAVLRVDEDVPYATLIKVLDALYEPKRDSVAAGHSGPVPVFEVRISTDRPDDASPNALFMTREKPPLPPELIQATIRAHYPDLKGCYKVGLSRSPSLTGQVMVRFKVGLDGKVNSIEKTEKTTLPDAVTVDCMMNVFRSIVFPKPEGAPVTVVYPIQFAP